MTEEKIMTRGRIKIGLKSEADLNREFVEAWEQARKDEIKEPDVQSVSSRGTASRPAFWSGSLPKTSGSTTGSRTIHDS